MSDKNTVRDNYGCFTGIGMTYWHDLARGLKPSLVRDRMGTRIDYAADPEDGLAANNGGILAPEIGYVERRKLYYRFYSAYAHNKYAGRGWHGHWWITENVFQTLKAEALENDESLRAVASRRLALPLVWSDIRYVVCATPKTNLKVWFGPGKVAHPSISPASAVRTKPWDKAEPETHEDRAKRAKDEGLYGDAPSTSLQQLFIPGDIAAGVFDDFFHVVGVGRVLDREALEFDFGGSTKDAKWPGAKRGTTHV